MSKFGIELHKQTEMIYRNASERLLTLAKTFKSVAVVGPRQSGKTSLLKSLFPNKKYVNLENPDTRRYALEDPRGFLSLYETNGAILDEVQRTPELFSYLQEVIDNSNEKGLFILSGSNNFLLQESISQSLAGRVAYLNLLPFTFKEWQSGQWMKDESDLGLMINGFYPPIFDQQIPALDWTENYIRTYIERDVRLIKNITNLVLFEKFVKTLAGRTGQEWNASQVALEVGVDVKTVQSWLSVLESSFIVFLLKPYHKNFNKTIVKRPKVYFYDTALVCYLLGIYNKTTLQTHPLKGAIFETMIVSEVIKQKHHSGSRDKHYYWRTKTGQEVDLVIEKEDLTLNPIEIKSGSTITKAYFKNLEYFRKVANIETGIILYAGKERQLMSSGMEVINWKTWILAKR